MRPLGFSAGYGLLCGVFLACGGGSSGQEGGGTAGGAAPLASAGARPAGGAMSGSAGTGTVTGGAGSGGADGGVSIAGTVSSGGAVAGSGGANAGGANAGGANGGANAGGASGGANAGAAGTGGGSAPCVSADKAVTIYMIGDSTMSVYASTLAPRMGWGQPFGTYFNASCATVVDKALSGRSSKSFFDEGAWTPVKDALKSGDYVFIQFGHNDEKSEEPTLYTEPQTTYKQFLTTYITDARAKMAKPVLLTSINRNNWTGTTVKDTHGAYPPAVRELAASLAVDLIDLTALTKAYFERLGQAETAKLFLILTAGQSPNYPTGVTDNTHLQEKGALAIGQLAMADAYARKLSVASLLKAVPVAP